MILEESPPESLINVTLRLGKVRISHGGVTIKIQKLGGLVGVSPQHLILRAAEKITMGNLPRLRSEVVTEDMQRVGTVSDVFGPVGAPFISVRPLSNESLEIIQKKPRGTMLFLLKEEMQAKKTRNRGRAPPKYNSKKFRGE